MPGKWKFIVTDIQGNTIGELMNAAARQVIIPLKATPTCSFTLQVGSQWAPLFTEPDWDGLIKAYRNNVLQFCGPVVSGQEVVSASSATVQVNAAGPFWRLNYRLLGRPPATGGTIVPWNYGTQIATYDLSDIAQVMLLDGNSQGYTGITQGVTVATSQGAAGPYELQPVGDAITNLSVGTNSFEFEVVPTEPTSTPWGFPQIGLMNVVPLIGSVLPNIVFEFGTPASNVQGYTNTIDRQGLLNRGYMLQPNVTDYSDTLMIDDATSEGARGVYAGAVDSGGVQAEVYRQVLLQANVDVRKRARQVINFTPMPNANWQPFDNYKVGDQVRCRAFVNGIFRFDAMFRIWGVQFDIDATGTETVTLQLTPPTS